jgi:CRISPR-associated exonuclease Cas4
MAYRAVRGEWKMAYSEDEVILVSAIAQYAYCPRRCALIYQESEFEDNEFTLRGHALHERADEPLTTREQEKRVERSLPLWSERLGLVGRADTVEFDDNGAVRPVEYKRGRRRPQRSDDLQLCAQAVCLEEMLGVTVRRGAIFYHESRRCREVEFDEPLRKAMAEVVEQIRAMLRSGTLPPPLNDARCRDCSLVDVCVPDVLETARYSTPQQDLYRAPEEGQSP